MSKSTKSAAIAKIEAAVGSELTIASSFVAPDNTPKSEKTPLPFDFGAHQTKFPFRLKSYGGTKEYKDKQFAILAAWREFACNFHSHRLFSDRDDNKMYLSTMEISGDIYVVGFHNGKPFYDRSTLVNKGLIANSSGATGVSLQGKGLKLPQAYLTYDNQQKLVVCSRNPASKEFIAGVSCYKKAGVEFESNNITDNLWENTLKNRLGKEFDKYNVFYLIKISPFFDKDLCSLGVIWPNLPDMLGQISEDIKINVGETMLEQDRSLDIAMAEPNHNFELFSLSQMHEAYRCRDDEGIASSADSEFVSQKHLIEIEGNGVKAVLGAVVRVSAMAGAAADVRVANLKNGLSPGNAYHRTLRDIDRSSKGSGSRPGKFLPMQGFLKVPVVFKDQGHNMQFFRFNSQPIAIMRDNETKELHSALKLPIYGNIKANLKTLKGELVVCRNPYLKIVVEIVEIASFLDTNEETPTEGDSISLLAMLGLRGDFLMHHTDLKYKELRETIMLKACEEASTELGQDHWLYQWCEERFEKPDINLYDKDISEGDVGLNKDKRSITKYDLRQLAHSYKLYLNSESEYFVAFKDEALGKFIDDPVFKSSKGCLTVKINENFIDFLDNRLADQWANIGKVKDRLKLRQEFQQDRDHLAKLYESFKSSHNGGTDIPMYRVIVDPVGYLDSKGVPIPFYSIDRDSISL
jgi:hypothetical protein